MIEFYEETKIKANYVLNFKNIARPNLEHYPKLEVLGTWTENGKTGYRLSTSQPEEKVIEVIKRELELEDTDFTLFNTSSFAWTRFL